MKNKKANIKILSLVMAALLMIGFMPVHAVADDDPEVGDEVIQQLDFGEGIEPSDGSGDPAELTIPDETPVYVGAIVEEGGKLRYYDENGNLARSIWVEDGGKRYFASREGYLCANCVVQFSELGKRIDETGKYDLALAGYSYCFGADGSVQSGVVKIGDSYYYCNPENDCRVAKNCWVEAGGKRYFASPDGSFYTNRFISFGADRKYYMGADGSVQSGIISAGGKYYYADPENDDIIRLNAWVESGGNRYYASSDGSFYMRTFISFSQNEKYYVGAYGEVIKGVFSVGGIYYYGDPDAQGKIAMNRWVEAGGKRYFASSDGSFYTDRIISFGSQEKYYVGSDGSVQAGIVKYGSSYYYGDPTDNCRISINKWVTVGSNKYFASPTGEFYTNQFIHFGTTHYYLDSYGAVVKTPFVIKGITITPDPTTGVISQSEYDKITDLRSPLPYSDYVLVDIPSQTLRYYVNGFEALFTYVVTGDKYLHPTPTGTFWLNGGKTQNATLIGEDYESFVYYWMPFIGGAYGMHDATWRSSFGGSIYMGNGSHGCVNMPYEKARELYFMIPVGTMVIIR